MSKVLQTIGGILATTVIATGSAFAKGCEVASSAACTAGKAISGVAESVAKAAEDRGKNKSNRKR